MPELPEVEIVCRGLAPVLLGRRLTRVRLRRPNLRIPFPPDFVLRLEGRRIVNLYRRAKYILADCEGETTLIMHLGMSGRLTIEHANGARQALADFVYDTPVSHAGEFGPHDHVVFETEGGTRIVFHDHRRFGLMTVTDSRGVASHPLLKDLGLEPLSPALTPEALVERLAGKRTPLKASLLDQRIVAGLGNIYVCEALLRARLSPRRQARTITLARALRLVDAIKSVLADAIAAGGSSLRDYAHADGTRGAFQQTFAVYDREGEPCSTPGCGATIRRVVQSNRSTFYCPRCQR